jgi:hypothetical protein
VSLHIDLNESDSGDIEIINPDHRHGDASAVDVTPLHRRETLDAITATGCPEVASARSVRRGGPDNLGVLRQGLTQHLVPGRGLDGDQPVCPTGEALRPWPVPCSDIDHHAAPSADVVEAAQLWLGAPVDQADDPGQDVLRQPGGKARRPGHCDHASSATLPVTHASRLGGSRNTRPGQRRPRAAVPHRHPGQPRPSAARQLPAPPHA